MAKRKSYYKRVQSPKVYQRNTKRRKAYRSTVPSSVALVIREGLGQVKNWGEN